jgi:hypothetical protein
MSTTKESWQHARRQARAHQPFPKHRVPLPHVIRQDDMELTEVWKSEHAAVYSQADSADYHVFRIELDGPQEQLGPHIYTTQNLNDAITRAGREKAK